MSPSHTTKKGIRYRYYVSATAAQGVKLEVGSIRRVSAPALEKLVLDTLENHVDRAADEAGDKKFAARIGLRVVIRQGALDITWSEGAVLGNGNDDPDCERRHLKVPFFANTNKRRRAINLPSEASGYVRPIEEDERQRLVLSIARGKAWLREILNGASTADIAMRESKSERAIRLTLSLAFLDPKLVQAALQGALPRGVSTRRLLDAPANWKHQWRAIGLPRPD